MAYHFSFYNAGFKIVGTDKQVFCEKHGGPSVSHI